VEQQTELGKDYSARSKISTRLRSLPTCVLYIQYMCDDTWAYSAKTKLTAAVKNCVTSC